MFFYISKIISALIWPSNVIAFALVGGTALLVAGKTRVWPRVWARRLLMAGVAGYVVCGYSPLGQWMVLPLEERFRRPDLPPQIAGILILGGFESASVGQARGELSLNEAGERLTEALLVAKARPEARVVFTGGDGSMLRVSVSAAGAVGRFLVQMGIAPERIVLEGESRTTFENAVFVKRLVDPKPGETWLLVTSAFHMPRAMGTFRKAGFEVVSWPSDYRTRGVEDRWEFFSNPSQGLERVDFAFKEWVGLIAYRLSGRTSALWPGPGPGPAADSPGSGIAGAGSSGPGIARPGISGTGSPGVGTSGVGLLQPGGAAARPAPQ